MPGRDTTAAAAFWLFRLVSGGVGGRFLTSEGSSPAEGTGMGSEGSADAVASCTDVVEGTGSVWETVLLTDSVESRFVGPLMGFPYLGFGVGGFRRPSCP